MMKRLCLSHLAAHAQMSITQGLPSPGAISRAVPAQRKTRVTAGTAIISKIAQPKPAMQMGNGMSSPKAVVIITSGECEHTPSPASHTHARMCTTREVYNLHTWSLSYRNDAFLVRDLSFL